MTDTLEIVVMDKFASRPEIIAHNRRMLTAEAAFAADCILKWAMVCAEPDGEDSAGRQKLRRSTSEEIVIAACETAKAAFEKFKELGWILEKQSAEYDDARLNKKK